MPRIFPGNNEEWRNYVEGLIKQHHTDIQRLWGRLQVASQAQTTSGPNVTIDPAGAGGGGGGSAGELAKTDAAITKGSSGTVSIWSGTPGSETDSGNNKTATNKFADIDSGKWCWVETNDDGTYLVSGEC